MMGYFRNRDKEEGNYISMDTETIGYFEINLPSYLQHDIDEMIKGEAPWDCLWCELYGSINSALYDNEITEEQAVYLRKKYLGI